MARQAASGPPQSAFLKPFWSGLLGPPWLASLVILCVLSAARFTALLSPFPLQELFFIQTIAMWSLPFLFLTASARREIGLVERGMSIGSMLLSALAGAACGLAFFSLGMAIYGDSPNNWCLSVRNYLHFDEVRGLLPPLGIFAIYALPAIFLNPIGEEILFRGVIQQSFARRFGPVIATAVNVALFGLVYLSLHGIWHDASGFHLRVASAAIAIALMAAIGSIFTLCRVLSGSLWPAMAAHAAFNLAMLGASIHHFLR